MSLSWSRSLAAVAAAALSTTVGLARADGDRIEVGTFAGLHLFSDRNELGVRDEEGAPSLRNAAAFGVRIGYEFDPRFALEGEVAIVPTRVRDAAVDVVNSNLRLAAVAHLTRGRLRPFVLLGASSAIAQSSDTHVLDNDVDLAGMIGAGVKLAAGPAWGARFDARAVLPPSSGGEGPTIDWELTLGLYRTFDANPTPTPAPSIATPTVVAAASTPVAAPTPAPPVDRDGDGIADASDRCPDAAEDKDGFQDDDGCPELDNDGDGVADTRDTCPAELESANGFQDGDGCPDSVPPEVARFTGVIGGIAFTGATATLKKSSQKPLDEAAALLVARPELHVEVSGHTGPGGDRDKNVELSRARAESVIAYLIEKGVAAADCLKAVGRGADQPPTSGTAERIEFRLVPPPDAQIAAPPTP